MTEEEQQIAIAEACGWVKCRAADCEDGGGCAFWWSPEDSRLGDANRMIPNYLNDLNAMVEAEKTISNQTEYIYQLGYSKLNGELDEYALTFASAPQRARAFLMTLGLWESTNASA